MHLCRLMPIAHLLLPIAYCQGRPCGPGAVRGACPGPSAGPKVYVHHPRTNLSRMRLFDPNANPK